MENSNSTAFNEEPEEQPARSAFTIIELLVIVAIIAVLAAILFPVFARAREPFAQGATTLKEERLVRGIVLYVNDFDDRMVPNGEWNSEDIYASAIYSKARYMPWPGLVQPYLRSPHSLFDSPLSSATRPFMRIDGNGCTSTRQCRLLYPTYGYCNSLGLIGASVAPVFTTAIAKPAEQVMLTEIWSANQTTFGARGAGANQGYVSLATAEEPDGAKGRVSWGTLDTQAIGSEAEGRGTAGVAFRYQGRTPVAFTDGHIKMLRAEALAQGTNWVRGVTLKASNLKNGRYLWDPRGL